MEKIKIKEKTISDVIKNIDNKIYNLIKSYQDINRRSRKISRSIEVYRKFIGIRLSFFLLLLFVILLFVGIFFFRMNEIKVSVFVLIFYVVLAILVIKYNHQFEDAEKIKEGDYNNEFYNILDKNGIREDEIQEIIYILENMVEINHSENKYAEPLFLKGVRESYFKSLYFFIGSMITFLIIQEKDIDKSAHILSVLIFFGCFLGVVYFLSFLNQKYFSSDVYMSNIRKLIKELEIVSFKLSLSEKSENVVIIQDIHRL